MELVGAGWALGAHRAVLAARCTYFRDLLQRYPAGCGRVPLEGAAAGLSLPELQASLHITAIPLTLLYRQRLLSFTFSENSFYKIVPQSCLDG